MNDAELRMWREASHIAVLAMGQEKSGKTRGTKRVNRADEDPAAYWCLTELIVGFARRHGRAASITGEK